MSQYLAKFYCGNTRGLCNYEEPLDYGKLLDRDFDSKIIRILDECKGKDFEKGYCCDPNNKELQKPMDDEYMEKLNRKFEQNIFNKDKNNNFHEGQIPLVKTLTVNGKLEAMNVCTCGGTPVEHAECVLKNCPDYRIPTRYEYCKMGSDINKTYCVVGDSPATSNENTHPQDKCNLRLQDIDQNFTHSHNFKIKNLYPDCYINKCLKDNKLQVLDELVYSSSDSEKYFKLTKNRGDSLESYKIKKNDTQLNQEYQETINEDKSLLKYFSL